jgi:uncharacterized protein (DUF1800 family)
MNPYDFYRGMSFGCVLFVSLGLTGLCFDNLDQFVCTHTLNTFFRINSNNQKGAYMRSVMFRPRFSRGGRQQKILLVFRRIAVVSVVAMFYSAQVSALSVDETRHLLTRTGFAPAPHEITEFAELNRNQAVKKLLAGLRTETITEPPALMFNQFYEANPASVSVGHGCEMLTPSVAQQTPHDVYSRRYAEHYAMKRWWWTELINTPSPLTERLTLMWHDHFATGFDVWALPQFEYNKTLRRLGAGDFKTLATAILRDPAMIYYLDNYKNVKGHPNENLAREFLELFTMGEGNYSEHDIKALAKVLAGHGLATDSCDYHYDQANADDSVVELLGKKGAFSIEQAVDVIFETDYVSEFVVKRFWIEFIAPDYDEKSIKRLAKDFKRHDYDIKRLLSKVLLHKAFWDEDNRGTLTKSPVELLVGMVRSFSIWMPDPDMLMADSALMGHDLFAPPNVAGWSENDGWVNPLTVVLRSVALDRVWNASDNIADLMQTHGSLSDGLLIRASSQQFEGKSPRSFDVYINDEWVETVTLALGDREDKKRVMGVLQEPELVFIPTGKLPQKIDTVKLSYRVDENAALGKDLPQLMIHWLEYKHVRYSGGVAKQVIVDPDKVEAATPIGMLIHDTDLTFDIDVYHDKYERSLANGESIMVYNVNTPIISELYSFGQEQPMRLKPAGIDAVTSFDEIYTAFSKLNQNDSQSTIPISAVLPRTRGKMLEKLTSAEQIKELTYSPLYQMK